MIRVAMREEDGVHPPDAVRERLHPQVRTGVHEQRRAVVGSDVNGWTGAAVA
jgi:hypothetical protein